MIHLTTDEKTAAVTVARSLLAAGWRHDYVDRDGCGVEHALVRDDAEIITRADDDGVSLTLSGLTTQEALLTLTGSPLIDPAPETAQALAQRHALADAINRQAIRYTSACLDYTTATVAGANSSERDRLIRRFNRRYRALLRLTRALAVAR